MPHRPLRRTAQWLSFSGALLSGACQLLLDDNHGGSVGDAADATVDAALADGAAPAPDGGADDDVADAGVLDGSALDVADVVVDGPNITVSFWAPPKAIPGFTLVEAGGPDGAPYLVGRVDASGYTNVVYDTPGALPGTPHRVTLEAWVAIDTAGFAAQLGDAQASSNFVVVDDPPTGPKLHVFLQGITKSAADHRLRLVTDFHQGPDAEVCSLDFTPTGGWVRAKADIVYEPGGGASVTLDLGDSVGVPCAHVNSAPAVTGLSLRYGFIDTLNSNGTWVVSVGGIRLTTE